jgi:radical SAM superfamily enzyme YgiQ (UPF0313 family)
MGKPPGLDLLLVHVPKFNNFYDPFGYFVLNNVVSYGTFAIADWADQNGYGVEILHMGVAVLFKKGFRLERFLAERQPRVLALSCHWHYQLDDVCRLTRRVKSLFPRLTIVVGGYTASLFADDLLASNTAIDYVIRGESEVPMVALMAALDGSGRISDVPNLSHHRDGQVRHNPISFVADKAFLENLNFCRLDLFPEYRTYLRHLSYPVYLRSYPKFFNYSMLSSGRLEGYMVPVGRGCPVNCLYCGGGNRAASAHFGRSRTTLISPKRVLADIERAKGFGVESLYFPFDPYPASDYYPRLFKLIRASGCELDATFESFGLPTRKFIHEFVATFGTGKRSQILISPETGDETLRSRCKGYPYSNAELFQTLDHLEQAGASVQLSYAIGLPGETIDTLKQTRRLWRRIRKRYRNVFLQTATLIDPDPASPAEHQGLVPTHTLGELIQRHGTSHKKSYTGWTYLPVRHVCKGLSRTVEGTRCRLEREKCRHFCAFMYYPWKIAYPINRIVCLLVGLFFRLFKRPLDIRDYL